jgi:hypothetical protein
MINFIFILMKEFVLSEDLVKNSNYVYFIYYQSDLITSMFAILRY